MMLLERMNIANIEGYIFRVQRACKWGGVEELHIYEEISDALYINGVLIDIIGNSDEFFRPVKIMSITNVFQAWRNCTFSCVFAVQ